LRLAFAVALTAFAVALVFGWVGGRDRGRSLRPPNDTAVVAPPAEAALDAPADPRPGTQETRDLVGVVRDAATDAPVTGAFVFVTETGCREIDVALAVRSDGTGRFRLAGSGPLICVVAAGYLPWRRQLTTRAEEQIVVSLERGGSIGGTVVDDTGRPLPGAAVWCHEPSNRVGWPNDEHLLAVPGASAGGSRTETTADGRFLLTGLAPGEKYEVRVALAGYSFWESNRPPVAWTGETGVRLVLLPLYALRYKVIDGETGTALPVAKVLVRSNAGALSMAPEYIHAPESSSGAEWTVQAFARRNGPGEEESYRIHVAAASPGYVPREETLLLQPGTNELEMALARSEPLAAATVRAAFAAAGAPYEGRLSVDLYRFVDGWHKAGTANLTFENGRCPTPLLLPRGKYSLRAGGYGTRGLWWRASDPAEFDVTGTVDSPSDARIELRGCPVYLDVRDSEGRPVRGYDLTVNPPRGASGTWPRWHIARLLAGDGPDLFLPPGAAVISASMPDLGTATVNVLLKEGEAVRVPLNLAADHSR
jgi:hypothetical protein